MAVKFLIVLSSCILCVVGASAQSQPPTPSQTKTAQAEPKNASKEDSRTSVEGESLPTPISQSGGPDKSSASQYNKDAAFGIWRSFNPSNWDPNWVIAVFTIVTAGAAWAQVRVYRKQAVLMAESLAETKIAAAAAKLSSETAELALKTIERADIQAAEIEGGFTDNGAFVVGINLKNFGRSAANKIEVYFCIGEMTDSSVMTETTPKFSMLAAGAATKKLGAIEGGIVTPEFINSVKERQQLLFITVTIKFVDAFGLPQGILVNAIHHADGKDFSVIPVGNI